MKYPTSNNRGFSLVELLAVLTLLSLIIMLVFSVYFTGDKQFSMQREKISNQENLQYLVKFLMKEVRKNNNFEEIDKRILKIKKDDGIDVYEQKGSELLKNGEVFVDGIEKFEVLGQNRKLTIRVVSKGETKRTKVSIQTEIFLRGGEGEDEDDS